MHKEYDNVKFLPGPSLTTYTAVSLHGRILDRPSGDLENAAKHMIFLMFYLLI